MAKKKVVKRGDNSPLFQRLEAIRIANEIPTRTAMAKAIGVSPDKYGQYKETKGITPLQEIALQAMEADGLDWIEFPE